MSTDRLCPVCHTAHDYAAMAAGRCPAREAAAGVLSDPDAAAPLPRAREVQFGHDGRLYELSGEPFVARAPGADPFGHSADPAALKTLAKVRAEQHPQPSAEVVGLLSRLIAYRRVAEAARVVSAGCGWFDGAWDRLEKALKDLDSVLADAPETVPDVSELGPSTLPPGAAGSGFVPMPIAREHLDLASVETDAKSHPYIPSGTVLGLAERCREAEGENLRLSAAHAAEEAEALRQFKIADGLRAENDALAHAGRAARAEADRLKVDVAAALRVAAWWEANAVRLDREIGRLKAECARLQALAYARPPADGPSDPGMTWEREAGLLRGEVERLCSERAAAWGAEGLRAENARLQARCEFAVNQWAASLAKYLYHGEHCAGCTPAEANGDAAKSVSKALDAWDREHPAGGEDE